MQDSYQSTVTKEPVESKKRILLIDDDEDEFEIFSMALQELETAFDFVFARSADFGLKMLSNIIPDYIFLDLNMPKLNGLRCLEKIKELKEIQSTSVFLYSTDITQEVKQKALNLGATGCIKKPLTIGKLSAILRPLLAL